MNTLIKTIEVIGIIAFALTGIYEARKKGMDIIGVYAVAMITAFGGGSLRDVILNRHPLFWIEHYGYTVLLLGLSIVTVLVFRNFFAMNKFVKAVVVLDALGLGLLSASGASVANQLGNHWFISALLGVTTGVFGAKPRSVATETRDGLTLPTYRGDMINRAGFTADERKPDPSLMLRAYERSGLTINFIRALIEGGFAELHHPEYWELGFVANSPHAAEYMRMVETIGESLRFMETFTGSVLADINRVDFFTSHEGLHLYYEQAQTRQVPRRRGWYNLSTEFPWIGDRTRALGGAHIEYFRGIYLVWVVFPATN